MKVFVEYGLDFDNNRFGLGRSVEFEKEDGTEYRTKEPVQLKNKAYYFRLWICKMVFILSQNNGFKVTYKKRNNLKIVFGIQGEPK